MLSNQDDAKAVFWSRVNRVAFAFNLIGSVLFCILIVAALSADLCKI